MKCEFASLPEHHAAECPRCNPDGWMAQPSNLEADHG